MGELRPRSSIPNVGDREYNGSMPTPTDGLATALAQVMETRDDDAPGSDPAEQLSLEDLLGLPPRPDGKPATAHIGRPPGSPNRRTKEWVKFLETLEAARLLIEAKDLASPSIVST